MLVSIDSPVAGSSDLANAGLDAPGLEHAFVKRSDGVYINPTISADILLAAFEHVIQSDLYLTELDYGLLIKALYDIGPDFAASGSGELLVKIASGIAPFDPARRSLYKAVKITGGEAEYYFEPVRLEHADDPDRMGKRSRLDVDEFIADLWRKGIRVGLDVAAVRAAIMSDKSERVIVARRLEPVPGRDAEIAEISEDIHRSDAPRQLANGKLDLMAFQNRFPQILKGVRLLKKVPRRSGSVGFELSGVAIEPAIPSDIDLTALAGLGTVIEHNADGQFLVSQQTGFLNVDSKTNQISVGDKIVSRDGVSSRTTGNLQLTGDYEEFGEVQEKRVIEGEGIIIHADVFGNIVSRGGSVLLNRNLMGGSAHNAQGDIEVKGVASGAVIQASQGAVIMRRAENCIISGTRVMVEHAVNCAIMADDVVIGQAEGCAVAARKITIDSAGPRKQSEMVVYALRPDSTQIDEVIRQMALRVDELGAQEAGHKAQLETLTSAPNVRKYLMLASRIRNKQITLTSEQVPQFRKLTEAVGPMLKTIADVSGHVKLAEAEKQAGLALVAQLVAQRRQNDSSSQVTLNLVQGETTVRTMTFNPDDASTYDLPAKDIQARLRASGLRGELIFAGSTGSVEWSSQASA